MGEVKTTPFQGRWGEEMLEMARIRREKLEANGFKGDPMEHTFGELYAAFGRELGEFNQAMLDLLVAPVHKRAELEEALVKEMGDLENCGEFICKKLGALRTP